jgi:transposase
MRIIGYIEHPNLKITVFKMEQRISVKFENAQYEQTYKFGDDERLSTLEAVRQLADEEFIQSVLNRFRDMHQSRTAAVSRAFPPDGRFVFEEII